MKNARLLQRWRARLSLRAQLILGYSGIVLLFVVFGVAVTYQLNRVVKAIDVLERETQNALAAEQLSQASLELLTSIDKGILVRDAEEFVTTVGAALGNLERSYGGVRTFMPTTIHLDTTVASIDSFVRAMQEHARTETWGLIEINRLTRLEDKIARMTDAIDEAVALTQTNQQHALRDAVEAQRAVYQTILLSFAVAVLVSAFMIYSTIRSITGSIRVLSIGANRLASGSLDHRVTVESHDELGQLGHAFNEMAEQLKSVYSGLEQRVTERTADLEQRSVQLRTASLVAREAAAIRDPVQLLSETVRLISERFGFYHAGIFLVDEPGEYAVLRAASSEGGQRMLGRGHKLKVGRVGIVGYVAGTGEPRVVVDVGTDEVFFDNPDLPLTRSELALPLEVRGQVIGVLDVQSNVPSAFTDEDIAILRTMADQVALAIENARLLEESRRSLQELELLYGQRVRNAWREWGGRRSPAYRYTSIGVEAAADTAVEEVEEIDAPSADAGAVPQAAERQLAVPIALRGQQLGSIVLRQNPDQQAWSASETALVQEVSAQVGLALENARLLEEARRRAQWEGMASDITARIRGEAEIDAILERAVEELGRVLGAERAVARLIGTGQEEQR